MCINKVQTLFNKFHINTMRGGHLMKKVFIDPGHGGKDPGAVGNGLLEKNITLDISQRIKNYLVSNYENVSVKMSRTKDQTVSLSERTNQANRWKADLYVSIHINAGGGRGFESFIYNRQFKNKPQTEKCRTMIHNAVMDKVNWTDRGKKQANFHVLRETTMAAVLTESGFIDNREDARNMKDSSWLQIVAEGHAIGIANALNLKKKSLPDQTGRLYRVVSGSFLEEDNARKRVHALKRKGYDSFIVQQLSQKERYYRVIVGAFSQFENAENRVKDLKKDGFDSFIVQM